MDITHQLDQLQAALRDNAATMYLYYADLKKKGFNSSQAFELVKDYQRSVLNQKNPPSR